METIRSEYSLAIQVVIERPGLNIARVGTNVVLSWSTGDSGYTLEAKTDLSSSLNWSNVLGTPTIVGNLHTVTNGVASGNLFYRLKSEGLSRRVASLAHRPTKI